MRMVLGQLIGDVPRSAPARSCGQDVAVVVPPSGAHVPAERRRELACGLQMSGDHRRVLVCRLRFFQVSSKEPVKLRAIAFELRVVGDGAYQRMAEREVAA